MTVAYPGKDVQEPEGIPIWVIIVGVLVGVLILVCLIILLWKVGRESNDCRRESMLLFCSIFPGVKVGGVSGDHRSLLNI